MAEDNSLDDFDDTFHDDFEGGESQFARSFRTGFGFTTGSLLAVSIAVVIIIFIVYLAVDGGYTTWGELFLLE